MKPVILTVMMSMTACVTETSDVYVSSCIPLVKYSKEQQLRVLQEKTFTPQATWVIFIEDYKRLRNQVKASCK